VSDSIVLVCAVLASLASGVLLAYGVCLGMFRVCQMRAEQSVERVESVVPVTAQVVEG
jgi:hypothetical protein